MWYWQRAGLNTLADKVPQADDSVFELITRRINGGLNGLKDRQTLYKRAMEVLQ
ncbi:glycoside hydrolase [Pseudomonas putida S11]|nr:glycoside hydrolase [Pseudomonas putida S11]